MTLVSRSVSDDRSPFVSRISAHTTLHGCGPWPTSCARREFGLIAYEVAGREQTYPWSPDRNTKPFAWITLFPDRVLETIAPTDCRRAMVQALDRDQPDVLGLVGYARPESMAAARWARRQRSSGDLACPKVRRSIGRATAGKS